MADKPKAGKSRISPLLILPPAIFAALAAVLLLGLFRGDPQGMPSTRIGQIAPALTVEPLGSLPGFDAATLGAPGVKLVNFWASWCAPCRAEHPTLMALKAEGLPVYGIAYKNEPADALGFLDRLGNPFAAAVTDPKGRSGIEWGLTGVPETFVIDGEGKVAYRLLGALTERTLAESLRPALVAAGWTPEAPAPDVTPTSGG